MEKKNQNKNNKLYKCVNQINKHSILSKSDKYTVSTCTYSFIFFSNMCTCTCVNLPQAGCTVNLKEGGHRDFYDCKFNLWELEFTQNYPGDFMVNLRLQTLFCQNRHVLGGPGRLIVKRLSRNAGKILDAKWKLWDDVYFTATSDLKHTENTTKKDNKEKMYEWLSQM